MNEYETTTVTEFAIEDLHKSLPLIAAALDNSADNYVKRGRKKAAKERWRTVLLPSYYLKASLMRRRARILRKTLLDVDRRYSAARHYFEKLSRVEKYSLEINLVEHRQDLEASSRVGARIFNDSEISQRSRTKLLRNYALLMAVCNFVPARAAKPDWTIKNRIAYVAASSLPYSISGYSTRTEGVALGYKGLGIDLQVITRPSFPLNIRKDLVDADIPDFEMFNGVAYHRLTKSIQYGLSPLENVMEAASTITEKLRDLAPECVIAASNHINALPALIAARRLGLPFIYEIRGFWEVSRLAREPSFSGTIEFAVIQELETFLAKNADHVMTLTSQMRDNLLMRGVDRAQISLMPNGVAKNFVQTLPVDQELAKELDIPEGCTVIGYIGSILEYEGLQDLAKSCVDLSQKGLDFRLLLVGPEISGVGGRLPISEEIQRIFKDAGILYKLIMPGGVPFSEVSRYYSLIDIAPIPRRPYEIAHLVTPIKPIEAMAQAKAVVVSDVAALGDMVEDGVTGLVFRAGDQLDLTEKLALLISDKTLAKRLQIAGQDFVRSNRTWTSICAAAAQNIGVVAA